MVQGRLRGWSQPGGAGRCIQRLRMVGKGLCIWPGPGSWLMSSFALFSELVDLLSHTGQLNRSIPLSFPLKPSAWVTAACSMLETGLVCFPGAQTHPSLTCGMLPPKFISGSPDGPVSSSLQKRKLRLKCNNWPRPAQLPEVLDPKPPRPCPC